MHSGGRSGRGIALILSGWRGFYVWLGREGLIASNPVQDVKAPKAAKPLPKALSVDDSVQLASYQNEAQDPWLEARDAAMVELLYGSGLRVAELVGLDAVATATSRGWVDMQAAEVHVLGKGGKRRAVPVGAKAIQALETWNTMRAGVLPASVAINNIVKNDLKSIDEQCFIFRTKRHAANGSIRLATPKTPQFASWFGSARASAHVAPFVCQPCAAVQR